MNKIYLNKLQELINTNQILIDEPMSKHTSFKTGGPCDVMVVASCENDIKQTIKMALKYKQKLYILGNCTNIIVRDKGIRGTVLKVAKAFDEITITGNVITASAGTLLSKLAKTAQLAGLSGLEFASGIPGTVGGGVSMNAGAYGGEIKQILTYSTYIDEEGNDKKIDNEAHQFSYRKSFFSNQKHVIVKSSFLLLEANKDEILQTMNELNRTRREKQPVHIPSAGSVFKRPIGYFTGQIIDQCKLTPYAINGAMVSKLHSGFIVNTDQAKSQDIIDLITHIQETVYDLYGVKLETEVKMLGEI